MPDEILSYLLRLSLYFRIGVPFDSRSSGCGICLASTHALPTAAYPSPATLESGSYYASYCACSDGLWSDSNTDSNIDCNTDSNSDTDSNSNSYNLAFTQF